MHNLEKILDMILSQAQDEAQAIREAAQQECEQIEKESVQRADAIVEAAQARAEREKDVAVVRAESTADMKKREILLATKVGILTRAFAEAEKYLYELPREEYCAFLAHLLADAAAERVVRVQYLQETYGEEEADSTDFELLLCEADQALAPLVIKEAKKFLKQISPSFGEIDFTLAEDIAPIRGGLILRYGDIESNCSVEAVIGSVREQMEHVVLSILFPSQENGET